MSECAGYLIYLGNQVRAARKACDLTQQELADQTGLAIKTIQDLEKGRKNVTYDILLRIIERLGISADILFPFHADLENEDVMRLIGKFRSCNHEYQRVLLNTLNFLSEQFIALQNVADSEHSHSISE